MEDCLPPNPGKPSRRQPKSGQLNPGQLLIIGFDGAEMTPRLQSLLTRLQPAGVILFARNIHSPGQTWQLLRDCQKCVATPLFTCVDLEGGTVDRFRDALGPTPPAADVFATGDRKLYRKHGEIIGASSRALGFNVDFAPVLDLAFEPSHSVMGSRTVSTNPHQTARYAHDFLAGLLSARVLGCGKHFPGLGEGSLDTHHQLPVIDKPLKKLWAEDLLPYRVLRRQLPFVMVSHAAYPQVTRDRTPASLSRVWITGLLRKRIGYHNLIVSDDLEMGAVLAAAPMGEAAVESIRAGCDLCLVCHHEEHVTQAHEGLVKAAESDKSLARRVTEAQRHVLKFKKKWVRLLRPTKAPSPAMLAKLPRKLWEFGEQVRLAGLNESKESTGRESTE
jgi:beta-N-acetylhexosaminidase